MIKRDTAMEIIRLHAEWVGLCKQYPAYSFTKQDRKGFINRVLSEHEYHGVIRGYNLVDGILWNEEDQEEYGMLSNVALTLDGKKPEAEPCLGPEDVWSIKLLDEFYEATITGEIIK